MTETAALRHRCGCQAERIVELVAVVGELKGLLAQLENQLATEQASVDQVCASLFEGQPGLDWMVGLHGVQLAGAGALLDKCEQLERATQAVRPQPGPRLSLAQAEAANKAAELELERLRPKLASPEKLKRPVELSRLDSPIGLHPADLATA